MIHEQPNRLVRLGGQRLSIGGLLGLVLGIASVVTGCAPGSRTLQWEFTFDDEVLADRTAVVEGRILSGGCGSSTVVYAGEAGRDDVPAMPSGLPAGRYGFEGRARDASCTELARGCVDVLLPFAGGERVLVTLFGVAEVPACSAAQCRGGRCEIDLDGGFVDAPMLDAPSLDARDAALDASFDGGALDAPRADAGVDAGAPDVGVLRALPTGDRIAIDFGPVAAVGWVTHAALMGTTGPLTSVGGAPTDVSVTTRGFTGEQTGGSAINTLGLPGEVSSDTLWVGTFDGHDAALLLEAEVVLEGVADGLYTLEIFASRDGDDGGPGRLTRYRVGTVQTDLDAQDNQSRLAMFDAVRPDAFGTITVHVTVSPAGTSRFAYIGSLALVRSP
jgi:hypothetical protein